MSDVSNARILVTGASGRIGGATVALLTESGAHVTTLSNTPNPRLHADRVLVGDTRSQRDVADALDGVDLIVHLAALAHRDAAPGYDVYSTNVVSTYNVLSQAAEHGVGRAVVAGSINRNGLPQSVHDGLVPAYFPIDTDLPVDISDWYSLSKLNDENTSRMVWRHWGMDVVTLQYPHVNTEDVLRGQVAALTEDPAAGIREAWSYLDVRDAARSILLGLQAETRGAHAFYLAADHTLAPYRTDDMLDAFAPGVPRSRGFVDREVPIDLTPARELIGFRAEHELSIETLDLPDRFRSSP